MGCCWSRKATQKSNLLEEYHNQSSVSPKLEDAPEDTPPLTSANALEEESLVSKGSSEEKVIGRTSGARGHIDGILSELFPKQSVIVQHVGAESSVAAVTEECVFLACDFPSQECWESAMISLTKLAKFRLFAQCSEFERGVAVVVTIPRGYECSKVRLFLDTAKVNGAKVRYDRLKVVATGMCWWHNKEEKEILDLIKNWMKENAISSNTDVSETIAIIDHSFALKLLPVEIRTRILSFYHADVDVGEDDLKSSGRDVVSKQEKFLEEEFMVESLREERLDVQQFGHGHGILRMLAAVLPNARFVLIDVRQRWGDESCCSSFALRKILNTMETEKIRLANFSLGFEIGWHKGYGRSYLAFEEVSEAIDEYIRAKKIGVVICKASGNYGITMDGIMSLPRGRELVITGGLERLACNEKGEVFIKIAKTSSLRLPLPGEGKWARKEPDYFAVEKIGEEAGTSYATVVTTVMVAVYARNAVNVNDVRKALKMYCGKVLVKEKDLAIKCRVLRGHQVQKSEAGKEKQALGGEAEKHQAEDLIEWVKTTFNVTFRPLLKMEEK